MKPGAFSAEQERRVAEAIALVHHEVTGAPPNLVHVILHAAQGVRRFVGGHPEEEHIWIMGYIRAGRTDEEIGRLMLGIAREVGAITGMDEHFVWVYICNIASEHMVKYGGIHPTPGGETAWFEDMPEHVKAYMAYNRPEDSRLSWAGGRTSPRPDTGPD
jgi:phenylpyruvate tautomerase PptA (4-oxalocrotonate tautomerase family)